MSSLKLVAVALQVVIALGLLNVWLLRSKRPSQYRGGESKTMAEEFAAYGLPRWLYYLVGAVKVAAGGILLVGLWIPAYVIPASAVVCLLMGCAVGMHFKVGDPLKKSLPALLVLAMSVCVLLAYFKAAQGALGTH
jgi:hypothetical protein